MFIVYITEINEDTTGGNISGNLLIYLPKKEECIKNDDAKYTIFVYFSYFFLEFEKFKVTIVKQ